MPRGPGVLGPGAKRFNVWIPGPMFAHLERIAQRGNLDTAVVIRKLLSKALNSESAARKGEQCQAEE